MKYSQYLEEPAILAAVEGVTFKRLLDIGAWDPVEKSNSRALIEAGWGGLLIEPSPMPLKNLAHFYAFNRGVTIIGAPLGLEPGLIELQLSDDAVSTSSREHAELWKESGGYYGRALFPAITLEQIANQFGGGFEFINIDTESTSVDVCRRIIDLDWRPRCICVEHDNRLAELCAFMTATGYKLVYSNGTNGVFSNGRS